MVQVPKYGILLESHHSALQTPIRVHIVSFAEHFLVVEDSLNEAPIGFCLPM